MTDSTVTSATPPATPPCSYGKIDATQLQRFDASQQYGSECVCGAYVTNVVVDQETIATAHLRGVDNRQRPDYSNL